MQRKGILFKMAVAITLLSCASGAFAAADPQFNKAVSIYLREDFAQALPLFKALLKKEPDNSMLHYYLALCYVRTGEKDLGVEEYRWIIKNTKDQALREIVQARLLRIRPDLASEVNFKDSTALSKEAGPVSKVILFSTTWCPTCRAFEPAWQKAKLKYGRDIKFLHLNAEDAANWKEVSLYRPKAYPTLVYLDSKDKVIENRPDAPSGPVFIAHLQSLGAAKK